MGIFPDAQGQLTPQSLVRSGQFFNSFETLWLSLVPDSIEMKELEWSKHFPYYKSMEIFPDAQGQLTPVLSPIRPNFQLV